MPSPSTSKALTRRHLLQTLTRAGLTLAPVSLAFGASDFWNKKPASEWSGNEVEQLKTKSPWAKKTNAEIVGGGRGGGRGAGGGGRGDSGGGGGMSADSNGFGGGGGRGGGGGGRGGRGGEGGGEGSGGGAVQGPEVIVRWENAKPILDATKIHLPADLDNHYAVSITGLPPQMLAALLAGGGGGRGRGRGRGEGNPERPQADAPPEDPAARQKAMVDRLLHSASLSAKGRDPQSAVLIRQTNNNETLIFGFPKDAFPLSASDKDVVFQMKLGPLAVKAKFEPKDMMYKGELSL